MNLAKYVSHLFCVFFLFIYNIIKTTSFIKGFRSQMFNVVWIANNGMEVNIYLKYSKLVGQWIYIIVN